MSTKDEAINMLITALETSNKLLNNYYNETPAGEKKELIRKMIDTNSMAIVDVLNMGDDHPLQVHISCSSELSAEVAQALGTAIARAYHSKPMHCPKCGSQTLHQEVYFNPDDPEAGTLWQCNNCKEVTQIGS